MSSTIIRKAREVDLKALLALCKESLLASYGELVEAEKLRPWSEGSDIEKYIRGSWPSILVALNGPDMVGMLSLRGNNIDIAWVAQALREQGIGQMLFEAAEEQVALRYDSISAECLGPDIETLHFYETRGYVKQREYEDNYSGVDKIVLLKSLTEPVAD